MANIIASRVEPAVAESCRKLRVGLGLRHQRTNKIAAGTAEKRSLQMELPPEAFKCVAGLGEGCFVADQLQQRIHHNRCLVRPVSVNRHLSNAGVGCNLIHAHRAKATLCYQAQSRFKDCLMR